MGSSGIYEVPAETYNFANEYFFGPLTALEGHIHC